jgi:hypothetical protein
LSLTKKGRGAGAEAGGTVQGGFMEIRRAAEQGDVEAQYTMGKKIQNRKRCQAESTARIKMVQASSLARI